MRLLLDTSVLIAGDRVPDGVEAAVASVSFAELAFGVRVARDPAQQVLRQARLDRLQSRLGPGLPFDDGAADAFGALTALVAASGRNPRSRALDLMIAATAFVHDAGVLTRNGADLAGIEALVPVVAPD